MMDFERLAKELAARELREKRAAQSKQQKRFEEFVTLNATERTAYFRDWCAAMAEAVDENLTVFPPATVLRSLKGHMLEQVRLLERFLLLDEELLARGQKGDE